MGIRQEIPAGMFKQGCLALIDDVAASKKEIVITKRGKPVARLVPMEDPRDRERELLARWRGKARQLVSLVSAARGFDPAWVVSTPARAPERNPFNPRSVREFAASASSPRLA